MACHQRGDDGHRKVLDHVNIAGRLAAALPEEEGKQGRGNEDA